MFEVDFKILNQKGTPAIYADTLALRPAAGFEGRLFVATDSPYGVFRDTGTAWVQVAAGTGSSGSTGVNGLNGTTNIGLGGTLANNTSIDGNNKTFDLLNTDAILFQASNLSNNGVSSIVFNSLNNSFAFQSITGSTQSSEIIQNKTQIITKFDGGNFGLSLNNSNGKFSLGDYNNDRKYNSFVVNDDANTFYLTTSYNQVNTDQDLFYASNATSNIRFVKLGDFNQYANQYSFIVDDANQFIKTTNATGDTGIILTNKVAYLGSYNSTKYLFLSVDYTNNTISSYNSAATNDGIRLDFTNLIYQFGSYNSIGNYIEINDTNNSVQILTSNLNFTGAALESSSSGRSSGQHLVITLNGNQYKIDLKNP